MSEAQGSSPSGEVSTHVARPAERKGHDVFIVQPVARGMHPNTSWNLHNMRTVLSRAGHRLHGAPTYRVPLDHARNELATIFLSTTADVCLTQDDDVQLHDEDVMLLLGAIDAGCDIVSAPCRMRSEGNLFNVVPVLEPVTQVAPDGTKVRTVECAWTGFGCVMFSRRVFEVLLADAERRSALPPCPTCGHHDLQVYKSSAFPERNTAATFRSEVVPAKEFYPDAPEGHNVYLLDDRVFCRKIVKLGFKIHAAIDTHTVHDGMQGCFAEELEKVARAQAAAQAVAHKRVGLIGPDGRPVGGTR